LFLFSIRKQHAWERAWCCCSNSSSAWSRAQLWDHHACQVWAD